MGQKQALVPIERIVFQITKIEKAEVVTICDHLSQLKFSPVLPYAFTEHGAIKN